jgi:phenylacetate-CoA ligase
MHPVLVRRVILPVHEALKRTPTFAWLRELERTQWLDRTRLLELQFARLKAHLQFAYDHTVYYRCLLDEHGLAPHRIQTMEEFRRIPPLTRELLRANFSDLAARRARLGRVQRMSTGGSTGAPVTLLVDSSVGIDIAVRHRAHRWFGAEPGAREVVLWGSPIELGRQDRVRSFRDWLVNSKLISAFDLSEASLARHAAVIERHRPEIMYGYASALYLLGRYLEKAGWRPSWTMKAVFTTAEPLLDFQRRTISSVFRCPTAVEYGARDAGNLAGECPDGRLHIPAECTLIETEGHTPEDLGEIIVTNLYSPAMPLIRYRTGDMGELDDRPCPCGRSLPVLKRVEGRRTDFLVTPDGRVLHALGVIYVLREVASVREFQIIQEAVDRVRVEVVPEPSFCEKDRLLIQRRIRSLLGDGAEVHIHIRERIVRAPSGKFRYVISQVADAYLERLLSGGIAAGPTARRL